jgi:6-phosphogluconolactonase
MSVTPVLSFETREAAALSLADALEVAARAALDAGRRARLALSGGTTPEGAYRALAARDLDWSRVDLALVDERWVDADDPASNEGLLRRAFAAARAVTIHPMKTAHATPAEAVATLDAPYARLRPFDAVALGMGPDAHCASWFPGGIGLAAALDPAGAATVAAIDAQAAPVSGAHPLRMTLTLPPVAEAGMVALLIFGDDKLATLEAALGRPHLDAPIRAAVEAAQERFMVHHAP